MYALILIRYRRPLEEIVAATEAHRGYLRELQAAGTLLASGPFDPRTGAAVLLRVPEDDPGALDRIRNADPFFQAGLA
ncbi:MAG: YciI family protein, partial [Gemmatimonadota bacterium]